MSDDDDPWRAGLLREQFAGPVREHRPATTPHSDDDVDELAAARRRRDLNHALDTDTVDVDEHDKEVGT